MIRIGRIIVSVVLLLCGMLQVEAVAPKYEHRSMWVATVSNIDWPSNRGSNQATAEAQKKEMIRILDDLQRANFNAVNFQIRPMADALYNSAYEPWSYYVSGQRGKAPAYDPLAFVVEECHKRGLECYGWVNPLRFSNGSKYGTPNDVQMQNDGWIISHGGKMIMNPALPAVRQRVVDVCKDILSKYDIDGLVFDDYFYPSGIPTNSSAGDYDQWKASGTRDFGDWRRANVNTLIKEVYEMIQSYKPYVRFGMSPRGIACTDASVAESHGVDRCLSGYDSQYTQIFCDPVQWYEDRSIDFMSPQIYWARGYNLGDFSILCPWWAKVAKKFGRHFYTSHSLEYFKDSNKTTREQDFAGMAAQAQMNRDESLDGAPGAVFYSYTCPGARTEDGKDFFDYMRVNAFETKALQPAMTWKDAPAQGTVQGLRVSNGNLTWEKVENVRYAVYLLPKNSEHSTKVLTAQNLKAHTYYNIYTIPEGCEDCEFAVTIVDRYGNEYEAAWLSLSSGGVEDVEGETVEVAVEQDGVLFSSCVDASLYDVSGRLLVKVEDSCFMPVGSYCGVAVLKYKEGDSVKTKKLVF